MSSKVMQLASITALGAGAIALTSRKAEASSIIVSSVLDTTIAFTSNAVGNANHTSTHFSLNANIFRGGKSTTFALRNSLLTFINGIREFASGARWVSVQHHQETAEIRKRDSLEPNGPDVTIIQYAFQNGGAVIFAGEGAGEASPELSSLAES